MTARAATWADTEVDRGWNAAERAESADADEGPPAPGFRYAARAAAWSPVASAGADGGRRDPEAIRNRLAAHAAGVSRGRAAAAAQPVTDDYAHEETGPA